MSMSTKSNPQGKQQSNPNQDAKLTSEVEKERAQEQGVQQIKAEGNTVALGQDGIQKELKEQLKANFEAWKEDSGDHAARDSFNSQAASIGKMAGLQGTRPRLSDSGDKLEFDA